MSYQPPTRVLAPLTITAAGQSPGWTIGDSGPQVAVVLRVAGAVSGLGAALDVAVQWSQDDGQTWSVGEPADVFATVLGAVNKVKLFTVKAPMCRLAWTVGGVTPSFAGVSAHAYVTA